MPTVFTHAVVGWTVGRAFAPLLPPRLAPYVAATTAVFATIPDLDVIGFRFGIAYADPFGHRGATHSLSFAAVAATLGATICILRWRLALRRDANRFEDEVLHESIAPNWLIVWGAVALATATHPLFDMLTNGGLGCALLAPWIWERMFFDWRPIPVAPIGLNMRVMTVLMYEMMMCWPLALGALFVGRNLSAAKKLGLWMMGIAAAGVASIALG